MQLSVVICTYNYAHFLGYALSSLVAQTDTDFEVVVVDDGSTDRTSELVETFGSRLKHLRYVPKAHTGLADSRNAGVVASTGTHIGFLDADDLWSPRFVERMRSTFRERTEIDVLTCDGIHVDASGTILRAFVPAGSPLVCGPLVEAADLFPFFQFAGSVLVFTRSAYDRTGPFVGYPRSWEDWDWVIRAARKGCFFHRLPERLVICRNHSGGLSAHQDEMLLAWLATYRRHWSTGRDPATDAHAWMIARSCVPSVLANYPPARSRELLRAVLDVFGHRRLLTPLLLATFVGVGSIARLRDRARQRLHGLRRPRPRLDVTLPTEALFASLPSS